MRKYIIIVILLLVVAGASAIWMIYGKIYRANVNLEDGNPVEFFIPTGSVFEEVCEQLDSMELLLNGSSFRWVARKKNYPNLVKPGRYIIRPGINNNQLVDMLRAGRQEPVMLVFNNIRTKEKLAAVIASQIEADSSEVLSLFSDRALLEKHGFTEESIPAVFIPNTYEIYWNTSAGDFLERMVREYRIFWNEKRLAKARKIGMDPEEVTTLASIVDEEALYQEEEPVIAGLYINRLKKGMRLQADPTVKYAIGDMNISRVLYKHLEIDSPYNTYRRSGLPPGPILFPSISAIDAVLDYKKHNYLYMCAKEDLSGYHNFATNLSQHNKNARLYQNALNRRKIFN